MAAALSPAALSEVRMLAAYVILLASYVVFALGKFPGLKIDRTGAAIIGAVGMAGVGIVAAGGRTASHRPPDTAQMAALLLNLTLTWGGREA